jgi:hypothetical protein
MSAPRKAVTRRRQPRVNSGNSGRKDTDRPTRGRVRAITDLWAIRLQRIPSIFYVRRPQCLAKNAELDIFLHHVPGAGHDSSLTGEIARL